MNWNNAPRPLDKELDQKGAQGEQNDIICQGPKWDDRKSKKRSNHNRAAAPDVFGEGAEGESPQDRAQIVDNRDRAHNLRRVLLLELQKGGVDVLGSVAERVEGGHQNDDVNKELPPSP